MSRGNHFGKMLSMTSFGESHGKAMGVVLDGVPAKLNFSREHLQREMDRRAPGRIEGTTSRCEKDQVEILSGIFENQTLGTPIAVIVYNNDQRSLDYSKLKDTERPGHGDRTYRQKFGIRDYRGGGRASGRETLARVIGGHFAGLILPNVFVKAYVCRLGPFVLQERIPSSLEESFAPYGYPEPDKTPDIKKYLTELQVKGDSCGGQIAVVVKHCPPGLGEPCFDKLKGDLSKSLLSIGACVSFSFGLGEELALMPGSEVSKKREAFGGIEGGISNGDMMFMQVTFKPTSTVGEHARQGRHDPCILPRAIPVVEAMVKFVLADHFLRQQAYKETM